MTGIDIDVDDIAVERATKGDRGIHLNRAELLLAFTMLNNRGVPARTIGELLGVSERSVTRWRSGIYTPRCRPGVEPHRPHPSPADVKRTRPVLTCERCGSLTTSAHMSRHRRRHHSEVA